MSTNQTLVEAVTGIGDAFDTFRKSQEGKLAEIADRLEEVESRAKSPGRSATPDGERKQLINGETGGPVRIHSGDHVLHVLDSKTRCVDVLPPERAPEVSLGRFLAAGLLGEKCADRQAVSYAKEFKQLTTGTSGLVIPTEYMSQWIDRLRANMVLNAAGVRTVPMDAKQQSHAALINDPAATWHSEAGAIDVGNPTFAARTLTAQTIVARCTASVEVSQDSPDFGEQLAGAMTRSIAQAIDRAGLVGSGTPPEPRGIINVSGVNEVTAVGTPASYAKLTEGLKKLLEASVALEAASGVAIMSPRSWATFEGLATGLDGDLSPLPRPRALQDTRFLVSTAVPNNLGVGTNESAIFLGDFRDLLLGIRREASVKVLEIQSYADNLVLEFVAFARVDFVATRPASFCVLRGVTSA